MKNIIILVLFILLGCTVKAPRENYPPEHPVKQFGTLYSAYGLVTIDSCEYIWSHLHYGQVLIHKQNCKYCMERNKKE